MGMGAKWNDIMSLLSVGCDKRQYVGRMTALMPRRHRGDGFPFIRLATIAWPMRKIGRLTRNA